MKSPLRIEALQFLFMAGLMVIATCCARSDQPTLKDTFENYFYMGTALNHDQIMGFDEPSIIIVEKQFNSITSENILKWESVHPEPGRYDFIAADSLVAFGERNGMFIVGHTLVWHNQTPAWVFDDEDGNPVSRDTLLQRMKDHIFTVVGRYRGRINGWDVVNEAVEDDGQLRQSRWLQIIGVDYLQKAFEWAHQADPDAKLYYNDFNMWKSGKREGVVRLVKDLQSRGIRIDGIGMQGHWGLDYPPLEELEVSILAYSGLGVKVEITELDLNILPNPGSYTGADITRNIELQKELNPYAEGLPDSMTGFPGATTGRYREEPPTRCYSTATINPNRRLMR
jgi:endo-1,4-beta-xylanase